MAGLRRSIGSKILFALTWMIAVSLSWSLFGVIEDRFAEGLGYLLYFILFLLLPLTCWHSFILGFLSAVKWWYPVLLFSVFLPLLVASFLLEGVRTWEQVMAILIVSVLVSLVLQVVSLLGICLVFLLRKSFKQPRFLWLSLPLLMSLIGYSCLSLYLIGELL